MAKGKMFVDDSDDDGESCKGRETSRETLIEKASAQLNQKKKKRERNRKENMNQQWKEQNTGVSLFSFWHPTV